MSIDIDALGDRFDSTFFTLIQNLGPQLILRAGLGLTPGQVFVLHFIDQQGHCSVSNLADKMEVNPSAITVMLDRLESHHFVVRSRNQTDRRVVTVSVTDEGKTALAKVMKARKKIMLYCLSQLPDKELNALVESLENLAKVSSKLDIRVILDS